MFFSHELPWTMAVERAFCFVLLRECSYKDGWKDQRGKKEKKKKENQENNRLSVSVDTKGE
jgi:hypothetical protein